MNTALLIYDGDCPVCVRARAWVEGHAVPGVIDCVPCRSEARVRRAPQVSETECLAAMQLLLPDGRRFAGADALPHLLRRTRRWPWLAPLLELPFVPFLLRPVYSWVARHRLAVSALLRPAHGSGACGSNGPCG